MEAQKPFNIYISKVEASMSVPLHNFLRTIYSDNLKHYPKVLGLGQLWGRTQEG